MHRWINTEKQRYYQAYLVKDLLGDWVLVRAWGSLNTARGSQRTDLVSSEADGLQKLVALDRRRQQRGYRPLLQLGHDPRRKAPVRGVQHRDG